MKRPTLLAVAALVAAGLASSFAWADEEQAAFDDVVIAVQTPANPAGSTPEEGMKAAVAQLESVRAKADAYLKKFPAGAHHMDVRLVDAQVTLRLGGLDDKHALLDGVAPLLKPILDSAPRSDQGAQALWVTISLAATRMNLAKGDDVARYRNEALNLVEVFLKDFPKTVLTPGVLDFQAMMFQQLGRDADAKAARERIVKEFPGTPAAAKADRDIRFRDLKGTVLDLSVKGLSGEEIDLKKFRGRVVFVDFWASWCPPCKLYMPTLVEVEKKYRDQGFRVVGISLDQDKKALEDYAKAAGMTWPEYCDWQGWQSVMTTRYFISGIPASLLIDKKGVVREVSIEAGKLEEAVKKLLAE